MGSQRIQRLFEVSIILMLTGATKTLLVRVYKSRKVFFPSFYISKVARDKTLATKDVYNGANASRFGKSCYRFGYQLCLRTENDYNAS